MAHDLNAGPGALALLIASASYGLVPARKPMEKHPVIPRFVNLGLMATVLLLCACAETPMGPTIPVVPGANKSFSEFQGDHTVCRNFAQQLVGDQARGANIRGIGAAALTTALGAGVGGAVGGGRAAGIGAAGGATLGAGLAGQQTSSAQQNIQSQFNIAFAQCMYGLGNEVPGFGR